MNTSLDALAPGFKIRAMELLARLTEARIPVVVVNTLRTDAEQAVAIATGHSWVRHSRHQDGMAIDVCPLEQFEIHHDIKLAWDGDDPVWKRIGEVGESLGFHWGGRWVQKDLGHFEL